MVSVIPDKRQANPYQPDAKSPDPVEQKIGELYMEFYRLRKAGKVQEEYDAMGALLNMLTQDRDHIRKTFAVKV